MSRTKNCFKAILASIRKFYFRFAPPGVLNPDNPNHWKEQLLYALVFLAVFVSFLILILSLPVAIVNGYWVLAITATSAYAVAVAIFLLPNIGFHFRALMPCAFMYAVGAAIVFTVGPFGASREWFFSFGIFAAIFYGWRGATSSLLINTLTFIGIGALLHYGFWEKLSLAGDPTANWYRVAADLFFINLITTFFVAFLFSNLEKSNRSAKAASKLLLKERRHLIDSRKKLELEIEQRKNTQQRLAKSRAQERKILDSIAAGILVVNRSNKEIVYANSRAQSMFGVAEEELVGNVCHDYICPNQQGACPIIDKGLEIESSERQLLTIDGKSLPILKTVVPINFQENRCLLETFIDISDRKRLESQLSQAQKMQAMGTLAGGIAHDFNNILSAIIGYTDLALLDIHDTLATNSYLNQIHSASQRAKDLVKQILSFSRKSSTDKVPIELEAIIKEVLGLLRATIPATIEIKELIDSDVEWVKADPTQVHQVLVNLCTNAMDAMKANGGTLTVDLNLIETDQNIFGLLENLSPGRYAAIRVTDTGEGITPSAIERMFEPFFTTKGPGSGTGMGLAVVHGIVTGHGGTIAVDSKIGQGTQFTVYLPIFDGAPVEQKNEQQTAMAKGTGRILYVDDEVMLTQIAQKYLEKYGYDINAYISSKAAMKAYVKNPSGFDIIITDMTMPELTGADLIKQIRKISFTVPIILCTGYSEAFSRNEALNIGATRFFNKPLDFKEIDRTIKELLRDTAHAA
jgi:PAS domain S-box-containing protein